MKYRDLLKRLHDDNWQHVRTTGSHLHYKHPAKPGRTDTHGSGNGPRPICTT